MTGTPEERDNKHAELIAGLRAAADYLEAHPDVPALNICFLIGDVSTKDELRAAARSMGSFEKQMDDFRYSLMKRFGPLSLEVTIRREAICRKVTTWECPDESLLELLP